MIEDLEKYKTDNDKLKDEILKLKNENNTLKNDLQKANKIIANLSAQPKKEIKNINTSELNNLKNELNLKIKEINDLKMELENEKKKNKKIFVDFDDIMVIYFTSTDQIINNHGIKCLKTDTFASVEEKLYQDFEEFRETNNSFIVRGGPILRFKKLCENNLRNGDKIQLLKME